LASEKSRTEDSNIRDLIKEAVGGAFFLPKYLLLLIRKNIKALGDALIAHWVN
jgi:hypothetical protein